MTSEWLLILCCLALTGKTHKDNTFASIGSSVRAHLIGTAASQTQEEDTAYALKSYLVSLEPDTSLIQEIHSACVILVDPDTDQIAQWKREDEQGFYITADDANWYRASALTIFDSLHIPLVSADRRYLRLVGNKKWVLDVKKKNLPRWNIILFVPTKEPKITAAIDISADSVSSYFGTRR
jgi:hypothetical protein